MNNYASNKEDIKTYIRGYELDGDNIIVTYGNYDEYTIPYNEENEKTLSSKMIYQAKNAKPYVAPVFVRVITVANAIILPLDIYNYINQPTFLRGSLIVASGLVVLLGAARLAIYIRDKKDIQKLKYFIEHDIMLNNTILNDKDKVTGLSKGALQELETYSDKYAQPINLSNIESYSIDDLKSIACANERKSMFNFSEQKEGPVRKRSDKNSRN